MTVTSENSVTGWTSFHGYVCVLFDAVTCWRFCHVPDIVVDVSLQRVAATRQWRVMSRPDVQFIKILHETKISYWGIHRKHLQDVHEATLLIGYRKFFYMFNFINICFIKSQHHLIRTQVVPAADGSRLSIRFWIIFQQNAGTMPAPDRGPSPRTEAEAMTDPMAAQRMDKLIHHFTC